MNVSTQRRVVAVSALVTFSMGFLASTADGEMPSARFLIGVGVAFTIISVITDLGSPIGAGFALLIMLTAVLINGIQVFDFLNKRTGKAKKKRKGGRTSTAPGPATVSPSAPTLINVPSKQFPVGTAKTITV